MKWTILLLIIVSLNSCKTQEEIAQSQMVETLNLQVSESQKLTADATVRMQSLEERMNNITGQVEESGHQQKMTVQNQIKDLKDKLVVVEENNKSLNTEVTSLKASMAEQKEYLDKVLKSLTKMSSSKSKPSRKLSSYDKAMATYKRGKYKDAKALLQELLKKKMNGSKRSRVLHNLGMSSYILKQDDQVLIYFSKLFTDFPKSGYNKNGLLFLGKSFQRMNKKEEAKQTFNELLTRFPKAKQSGEAKKLLAKL
jgi:TolA-binding protein